MAENGEGRRLDEATPLIQPAPFDSIKGEAESTGRRLGSCTCGASCAREHQIPLSASLPPYLRVAAWILCIQTPPHDFLRRLARSPPRRLPSPW